MLLGWKGGKHLLRGAFYQEKHPCSHLSLVLEELRVLSMVKGLELELALWEMGKTSSSFSQKLPPLPKPHQANPEHL